MSRWGLQARIAATLAVVTVVVLAVTACAAVVLQSTREMQNRVVDHYYTAVTLSNKQFTALLDAETAVRGYALTGDPAALAPLREAQNRSDGGAGDRLHALLADDPRATAALDKAAQSASTWYTTWAEPTIAAVQEGGPAAVTPEEISQGKDLFDRTRQDYGAYIETVSELRQDAVQRLQQRTSLLFVSVVAVAVVAVVTIVLLWLLLHRWVTLPLSALAAETRKVHEGELDHRVSAHGPAEVVRLASDVEDMRRRLVGQLAQVRQSSHDLAAARDRLEEQTADLQRSNRELEQFAYVASHDLQEPLRKVASFCQLLQRRYAGQLDERADQYIEFAVDGAKRMQRLINDLLDFSRVGRLTAPQTDVDLGDCLDRALQDLESAIEESGAQVTSDELPVVRGEGPLLAQVMLNLVGNAIKFRSEEPPRVHIGARRDGEEYEISVADNGIGIDARYAERVFVLFQRLHPKDVYSGTGIGLSLSKKIIEYHGGRIWLHTAEEGRGTTIKFRLPVPVSATPDGSSDGGTSDVRKDDETGSAAADVATTSTGAPHAV
jgi:signal transduction histidine kinase